MQSVEFSQVQAGDAFLRVFIDGIARDAITMWTDLGVAVPENYKLGKKKVERSICVAAVNKWTLTRFYDSMCMDRLLPNADPTTSADVEHAKADIVEAMIAEVVFRSEEAEDAFAPLLLCSIGHILLWLTQC